MTHSLTPSGIRNKEFVGRYSSARHASGPLDQKEKTHEVSILKKKTNIVDRAHLSDDLGGRYLCGYHSGHPRNRDKPGRAARERSGNSHLPPTNNDAWRRRRVALSSGLRSQRRRVRSDKDRGWLRRGVDIQHGASIRNLRRPRP